VIEIRKFADQRSSGLEGFKSFLSVVALVQVCSAVAACGVTACGSGVPREVAG